MNKLTEEVIAGIRKRLAAGKSTTQMEAFRYSVSRETIRRIARGDTYVKSYLEGKDLVEELAGKGANALTASKLDDKELSIRARKSAEKLLARFNAPDRNPLEALEARHRGGIKGSEEKRNGKG